MDRIDSFGVQTVVRRSRPAQVVASAYVVVGVWYLWWRCFHTINTNALYLSIPLLAADLVGFLFFCLFAFNLWSGVRRYAPPPPAGLSVDVFIPTYNEPRGVLKPTILSALAMDYPHRTYVLDDGRRNDIKALCAELGADYLTRPDNRGAKAGNVNAALPKTDGEFIAIFDADHAPFRNFLTALLGYFRNPSVALVQAPQAYYNLDSFQHGRRRNGRRPWHEQSVFYDAIMPGKDRMNAAFWCGSSAIVRRAALDSVGGVNTLTLTEDMHTAMCMHAAGWETVYHDGELAVGIAPDDVEPFLIQRLRWAQGAMEILRKDNPLRKAGLSWRQRLSYFTSAAYVIEYLPKAVYFLMPPIILFAGVLPMTNMGWNLLFRFLPYYLLGMVATQMLTRGTNPLLRAERFHLLKLEIMLRALTFLVWPRKLNFKVTPKGAGNDRRVASLRHIRAQIVIGLLSVAGSAWGFVSWLEGAAWALSGPALTMTLAWAGVNAGLATLLVRSLLARHHRREMYRFEVAIPIEAKIGSFCSTSFTHDVSTTGLAFIADRWFGLGQVVDLTLFPDDAKNSIHAAGVVTSCRRDERGFRVGAEFSGLKRDEERRLTLALFQTFAPGHVEGVAAAPTQVAA